LLGSLNLARFVVEPFTAGARLDLAAMSSIVKIAVRMLDNVVDVSSYPLESQRREAEQKRRIGLGVTGLADALIMCGLRYGAEDAVEATRTWMEAFRTAAYQASIDLAREKGPFPLFDRKKYLAGKTIAGLPRHLREGIAEHGIRNALVTSIAPTGTISLLAENVSSGLEPVFSFTYARNILMPGGERRTEEVTDYAYALFRARHGAAEPLPSAFVDVQSLAPHEHLAMQAAVQDYIDSSISKTINLAEDISFDAFAGVYMKAYDLGCKGCTTYRPSPVRGAVLEARPAAKPPLPEPSHEPQARPETLPGRTYKLRWPESDHAIYITVNDILMEETKGRTVRRPFEVFINSKNMEHYAWTVALTRMISAVFRRGGDVSFVVEELKAVFDPRGGQWMDGRYVPSLLAAIGDVIERHMVEIGFLAREGALRRTASDGKVVRLAETHAAQGGRERRFRACPKCGNNSLVRLENCDSCTSCGFSRCS
jgi:ribonucleoside-diphosphate reductase alpha chain